MVAKLDAIESQAFFYKPNPADREMMATKSMIESTIGQFMKWEDVDFKYCPEWPDLAWAIGTAEGWEDRPRFCLIKSGMATGKSTQGAIASATGLDRWRYEKIEMTSSIEVRGKEWRM